MQSIFEIAEGELVKSKVSHGDVSLVRIKVGELTAVEEASMQFAFEVLKEGTGLENAKLELIYVPGEACCSKCDLQYSVEKYRVICPECGESGRIVAGKELYVDSLEVDDCERD